MEMITTKRALGLAFLVCVWGLPQCGPRTYAQQNNAVVTASEEFIDSIKKGDLAKVREILKQDPSLIKSTAKNGASAIQVSVYAGQKTITDLLLATGVELNIFEAVATGRLERVRELLKKNPELIHAYSADGWTPLHLNFGNVEMAKFLMDSGADLNAVSKNKFTATPLQGSVVNKSIEVGRLLLARGANVNPRNDDGGNPLHEAAGNGDIEFARLLLAHGANLNAKDDNGKTPLAIALEYKQPEMAKLLRDKGAVE
jgi:ankyrin repeat protein